MGCEIILNNTLAIHQAQAIIKLVFLDSVNLSLFLTYLDYISRRDRKVTLSMFRPERFDARCMFQVVDIIHDCLMDFRKIPCLVKQLHKLREFGDFHSISPSRLIKVTKAAHQRPSLTPGGAGHCNAASDRLSPSSSIFLTIFHIAPLNAASNSSRR